MCRKASCIFLCGEPAEGMFSGVLLSYDFAANEMGFLQLLAADLEQADPAVYKILQNVRRSIPEP